MRVVQVTKIQAEMQNLEVHLKIEIVLRKKPQKRLKFAA